MEIASRQARQISFPVSDKLLWEGSPPCEKAILLADVDNDGHSELVIGGIGGELGVFKTSKTDLPWRFCDGLGAVACILCADIFNQGWKSLVVVTCEGMCHVFNNVALSDTAPSLSPHSQQRKQQQHQHPKHVTEERRRSPLLERRHLGAPAQPTLRRSSPGILRRHPAQGAPDLINGSNDPQGRHDEEEADPSSSGRSRSTSGGNGVQRSNTDNDDHDISSSSNGSNDYNSSSKNDDNACTKRRRNSSGNQSEMIRSYSRSKNNTEHNGAPDAADVDAYDEDDYFLPIQPSFSLPLRYNVVDAKIADIDGDGLQELVIGTSDRLVVCYKFRISTPSSSTPSPLTSEALNMSSEASSPHQHHHPTSSPQAIAGGGTLPATPDGYTSRQSTSPKSVSSYQSRSSVQPKPQPQSPTSIPAPSTPQRAPQSNSPILSSLSPSIPSSASPPQSPSPHHHDHHQQQHRDDTSIPRQRRNSLPFGSSPPVSSSHTSLCQSPSTPMNSSANVHQSVDNYFSSSFFQSSSDHSSSTDMMMVKAGSSPSTVIEHQRLLSRSCTPGMFAQMSATDVRPKGGLSADVSFTAAAAAAAVPETIDPTEPTTVKLELWSQWKLKDRVSSLSFHCCGRSHNSKHCPVSKRGSADETTDGVDGNVGEGAASAGRATPRSHHHMLVAGLQMGNFAVIRCNNPETEVEYVTAKSSRTASRRFGTVTQASVIRWRPPILEEEDGTINASAAFDDDEDEDSCLCLVAVAALDGSITLLQQQQTLWTVQLEDQFFALDTVNLTGAELDNIVVCAWDGSTYIMDCEQNAVQFRLEDGSEQIVAFRAGRFARALSKGDEPCLVYVTMVGEIYIFPVQTLKNLTFPDALQEMSPDFQMFSALKENEESLDWTRAEQASLIHSSMHHHFGTEAHLKYIASLKSKLADSKAENDAITADLIQMFEG